MARMRTYLRPHKNNAPDALQYTPSFSGADTNWQLFHGPGGTAPSPTQNTEEGIAVEIVFEGRDAAIFIGDDTEPALRVPRLALEPRTGRLTFWSSIMQPTEHELPVVLENIRVRPSSSRAIPAADPLVAPDGAVMAWGLGEAFRTNELAEEVPTGVHYQERSAEPDGMLIINRHVRPPEGQGVPGITAGIAVAAAPTTTAPARWPRSPAGSPPSRISRFPRADRHWRRPSTARPTIASADVSSSPPIVCQIWPLAAERHGSEAKL